MSEHETPLDRWHRLGYRGISVPDLIAIALGEESGDLEVIEKCIGLLKRSGINRIGDLGASDLSEISPTTESEARRILAAIEIGRRSGLSGKGIPTSVTKPKDAFDLLSYLQDESREHFCALMLNSKRHLIAMRTIHIGTLDASLVGLREVYREAIRDGASSLIVAHNHPSGDPNPSQADMEVTRRLKEVGDMLDIELADHIIIGHHAYFSFREKKLI